MRNKIAIVFVAGFFLIMGYLGICRARSLRAGSFYTDYKFNYIDDDNRLEMYKDLDGMPAKERAQFLKEITIEKKKMIRLLNQKRKRLRKKRRKHIQNNKVNIVTKKEVVKWKQEINGTSLNKQYPRE